MKHSITRSLIVILFVIILGFWFGTSIRNTIVRNRELQEDYMKAIELMMGGQYVKAGQVLDKMEAPEYMETQELELLCELARMVESHGYFGFFEKLEHADFVTLPPEQRVVLLNAVDNLTDSYHKMRDEEYRREQAEETENLRRGVPYVGLSEYRIGESSLGKPSPQTRSNYECINGEQYLATIYDFVRNGKVIFTVRCVRGVVTEVWDKRDDVSYTTSYSWKKSEQDDPYDAANYSNEEDFYYDHYDDFFDYYDAESYWREHRDD